MPDMPDAPDRTFEETLERLEKIVDTLEDAPPLSTRPSTPTKKEWPSPTNASTGSKTLSSA